MLSSSYKIELLLSFEINYLCGSLLVIADGKWIIVFPTHTFVLKIDFCVVIYDYINSILA